MKRFSFIADCPAEPYEVTSGILNDGKPNGATCVPIEVTLPNGREDIANIQGFIASVEHGDNYPWFVEHYPEILLGKNSDWYLYWFEVSADLLTLNFYCRVSGESIAVLLQNDLIGDRCLTMYFGVRCVDGAPASSYQVCLRPPKSDPDRLGVVHSCAEVTEWFKHGYRVLTFIGVSRVDQDGKITSNNECRVRVDDYTYGSGNK